MPNIELKPIQRDMLPFMIDHPRCNIWVDPGGGKTSAVLMMLEAMRLCGSTFFPALVVGPKQVAESVWDEEAVKWDDFHQLEIIPSAGVGKKQREAIWQRTPQIMTVNYELLPQLVDFYGDRWPFKTVIADESTRLRGFRLKRGSKRAAALAKVAKWTGRWVNLTGTPRPTSHLDLWGQMWFVDRGKRLGRTYTAFKERWFNENLYSREITPKPGAEQEIGDLIADVTLDLDMRDYYDIDHPQIIERSVRLPRAAMQRYTELEQDLATEFDQGMVTASSAADKSLKLLQVCSGALYTEGQQYEVLHSAKIEALESLIEELSGAHLLVAYWFKHDLWRLQKAFPKAEQLTSPGQRKRWNEGKIPIALVHPSSLGHGVSLQHGGHHLVFFSNWWSLETYLQLIDRIGPVRQMQSGYNRLVYVYELVAKGTVDEDVIERRRTQKSTQQLLRERVRHYRQ